MIICKERVSVNRQTVKLGNEALFHYFVGQSLIALGVPIQPRLVPKPSDRPSALGWCDKSISDSKISLPPGLFWFERE